ncbi:MAG TPA: hypothetical protein VF522_13170 [Ramlibacter sp.]|uniref:hypothetical protein n=1 Tax=Ramlibacter sp. TaxID=1917967 RepID=UPI002ED6BD59
MRQVYTSVQPISPQHARAGQAGVVWSIPANDPTTVGVKWDTDGAVTVENCADLRVLG